MAPNRAEIPSKESPFLSMSSSSAGYQNQHQHQHQQQQEAQPLLVPESPVAVAAATAHHQQATNKKTEHLGGSRQYWRDIILGVNDGIISTFLLVVGVVGGGLSSQDVLLTAIAGALAGAVSMAAGEFVATKSQNEVLHGELRLEQQHVSNFLEDEIGEVRGLLDLIGIPRAEREMQNQLLRYYRHNPDALLKIMKTLEFGVLDDEERSPITAALCSCFLFLAGSLSSVLPFVFCRDPLFGLTVAAIATTAALLLVGGVKTWATRGNCVSSAVENLAIAGCGGVLAYATGALFNRLLHEDDL